MCLGSSLEVWYRPKPHFSRAFPNFWSAVYKNNFPHIFIINKCLYFIKLSICTFLHKYLQVYKPIQYKTQHFTKEIVLLTYWREFIKPLNCLCMLCSLSEVRLLSRHKTQTFMFKTKCCLKKTSDLIYTLVPVHFVGCSHYITETNWNYSNTRSKTQETPKLDNCSRFTNTVICTNINSLWGARSGSVLR